MKNVCAQSADVKYALKGLGFVVAIILSLTVFQTTARADSVTLTSGTVSVQVNPGQTSLNFGQPGVFSLTYLNTEFVGPLSTSLNFQSITLGSGSATLNGVTTQYFTGFLVFNNNTISGQVTTFSSLAAALSNNPLFVVSFNGDGSLTTTTNRHVFTVQTPEPMSLTLLGLALSSLVFKRPRSSRKDNPDV